MHLSNMKFIFIFVQWKNLRKKVYKVHILVIYGKL